MKKLLACFSLVASLVCANTLAEIKSSNTIRIGLSDHMAPFSKLNADGTFEGFEVEFAKEVAKAILGNGGKVEFIPVKQADRLKAVTENKVDLLIAAYTKNANRAKVSDWSIPYFSISLAVVAKKNSGISSIRDLQGKKIAAIHETNSAVWIDKQSDITRVSCDNNRDCYEKMENGEADGYMHNIVSVATVPLMNDEYAVVIPRVGSILFDCVVTQKGNKDLLRIVDNTILNLSDQGYFKKAYDQTFEPFYKGTVSSKYFLLEDLYESFR